MRLRMVTYFNGDVARMVIKLEHLQVEKLMDKAVQLAQDQTSFMDIQTGTTDLILMIYGNKMEQELITLVQVDTVYLPKQNGTQNAQVGARPMQPALSPLLSS
jgi:hypothetical protein